MNNHFNKRGRNNHQRRRQGLNPNRALDSNGPDVRIRGTAQQIYDKYQALARDASSAGDRVKAENYLQHAEHYFRVLRSIQGPQAIPIDQNAQDGDYDGDQPSIGDIRNDRQQSSQGDDEESESSRPVRADLGQNANGGGDAGEGDEAPAESAGEQRAQNGDGNGGQRRRRRPRRPRENGGEQATADESEPTPAS